MATNYPGSLDTFDTIASDKKTSDSVGGRTHRQMHNDVADALEAVQAELGTDPAGTFATVKARLAAYDAYAAKTGAYTATVDDNTLNVTSGTFTLDLPAASTCTGKTLRIINSGTGVVTLDGNSAETVGGLATFPLGNGSDVQITSTGSAWLLSGRPDSGTRDITASLANGWTGGALLVRRTDDLIEVIIFNIVTPSPFNATICELPAGFRSGLVNCWGAAHNYTSGGLQAVSAATNLTLQGSSSTPGDVINGSLLFRSRQAWQTTLPGSAY